MSELLLTAIAAAEAGAAVLRRWFRQGDLEVRAKAPHDLVSRADRESEAAVVAAIRARFPDHAVIAEESGRDPGGAGAVEWLVDPLDGTANFVHGLPLFCVAVACRVAGRLEAAAILDPLATPAVNLFTAVRGAGARWNEKAMRVAPRPALAGAFLATGYPFRARPAIDVYLAAFREVFLQAQGIRRCGSACLDLAYTAAGVYDGFFEFRLAPWDIAAGALLVTEAGGRISDIDGGEAYLETGNVVAGAPGVHAGLLAAVGRHASEGLLAELFGVGDG